MREFEKSHKLDNVCYDIRGPVMGKTETEVSRWLSGTHNFTIATIAKITKVLGEAIIQPTSSVVHSYMLPQQERSIYLSDPEA